MHEPLRVLILEENETDAEQVVMELRRGGVAHAHHRVETREDFLDTLRQCSPDVVIANSELSRYASFEALRDLQEVRPAAAFIFVAGEMDEQFVVEAMRAGADDVVGRARLGRLPAAVNAAAALHRELDKLSARQVEVLRLVALGYTTPKIARELRLSEKTIETHRTALMRRLGIHDVVHLVHFAVRVRLVPLQS
jgi:DNA-binding NarL/FixJ family response regulator